MKKNRKLCWILPTVLLSCVLGLVVTSFNTFGVKAELIVPDDYEYVDTWDDSYLLTNLEGEKAIEAEGTPTGTISQSEEKPEENVKNGCSSGIVSPVAAWCFTALIGVFFVKKRISK